MEIWNRIPDRLSARTALCIGKFDGFHKGHRLLIDEAKKTGCPVAVLTFVFQKTETIDSVTEKRKIAADLGVDIYIEIEAGPAFFSMTPESFIRDIVEGKLRAAHVIVGKDFRFGRDRAGDIETLKDYSESRHYELHAMSKLTDGSREISSSRIREDITNGDMESVTRMLARPYSIEGEVTDGAHLGRRLGVPTANLYPDLCKVMPPYGVYVVRARIEGEDEVVKGIANLGVKPTVGNDNPVGLEVHLLDYQGDIYGKKLNAELMHFIRKERRFDDVESLHRQIDEDIRRAKEWR